MKKVITLSTGIAEPEFLEKTGIYFIGPYSISKVATNMVVTKYSIQFKEEGFVFVALSPGFVNTLDRPRMFFLLAHFSASLMDHE